jgi:predicted histidine transporter YuiF (NhaC family)
MASMASNAKLIAVESVILGDFARFGSESQIMDTNFHQMIDTTTGERYKVTQPVVIIIILETECLSCQVVKRQITVP